MNRPAESGGGKVQAGGRGGCSGWTLPTGHGGSPQPHLETRFVQRRLGFITQLTKGKALDGSNRRGLVLVHSRAT